MDMDAHRATSCSFVDAGMEAPNEIETPISPRYNCDIVASLRFIERVAAKEEEEGWQFASHSQTGSGSDQRFQSGTTAGAGARGCAIRTRGAAEEEEEGRQFAPHGQTRSHSDQRFQSATARA